MLAAFFPILAGCTVKPDQKVVKDAIVRYFQERHYMVIEMNISEISSIPVKSRVYMGPEGYTVNIGSITLEATEDTGPPLNYKKGQLFTFSNATINIRAGEKGKWLVSHISGITVI